MKKILLSILLSGICFLAHSQGWNNTGNALQRQVGGSYINYRFNLGAVTPAFLPFYSKAQVDSLKATIVSGVSSFNTRTGAIVPLVGDYSAFYAPITGSTNYIQNQSVAAQTANQWIGGNIRADGDATFGTSYPSSTGQNFTVNSINAVFNGYLNAKNHIFIQNDNAEFALENAASSVVFFNVAPTLGIQESITPTTTSPVSIYGSVNVAGGNSFARVSASTLSTYLSLPTSYIQNQNSTPQSGTKFWIDGASQLGGSALQTGASFANLLPITGGTTAYGTHTAGTVQSDVTNTATYFSSITSTAAAVFTLTNLNHYRANQGTFGTGSIVTNQTGFLADGSLNGAASNVGFEGVIPIATNNWNLYMPGTAQNYFAGWLGLGVNKPKARLDLTGTLSSAAWGANGINISVHGSILTDNSSASGTVAFNAVNAFMISPLAATNTGVTYTTAATVYIAGAPSAGTNVSITKSYASYIATGDSFFGGNILANNLTASRPVFTDASKNLTSTGPGTTAQYIRGDGTLATLPSGTVTSVTSANTDIGIATGTTTPVLTLNRGGAYTWTGFNQFNNGVQLNNFGLQLVSSSPQPVSWINTTGGLSVTLQPTTITSSTAVSIPNITGTMLLDNTLSAYTPTILATISGINATSTASTVVYTVPAGKTLTVTQNNVRMTTASGLTVGPTYTLTASASGTIISTQATGMTTAGKVYNFPITGLTTTVGAGETVSINVTGATGTSGTIQNVLVGYLQ